MDSLCHPWFTTTNLSYRFPIFETSATALCGTTGICMCVLCMSLHMYIIVFIYIHIKKGWTDPLIPSSMDEAPPGANLEWWTHVAVHKLHKVIPYHPLLFTSYATSCVITSHIFRVPPKPGASCSAWIVRCPVYIPSISHYISCIPPSDTIYILLYTVYIPFMYH